MRMLSVFRRDERGAVIMEFALVVPLLMFIVFGIIDFSRAYYTMNDLTAAVREGARYASVLPDPSASEADIRDVVKTYARNFGGDVISDAEITIATTTDQVTVSIENYPFQWITPVVRFTSINPTPITRRAIFRRETAPSPSAPPATP